VSLDPSAMWITNNGNALAPDEVRSLCDVKSRKSPAQGALGYMGMGFKSIFKIADRVDVHSGESHFKFDRSHWADRTDITNWPWEVLPIEIEPAALPDGFNTGFVLPMNDPGMQEVQSSLVEFLSGDDFPAEILLLLRQVNQLEIDLPQRAFVITKEPSTETPIKIAKATDSERPIVVERLVLSKTESEKQRVDESAYLVVKRHVIVDPKVAAHRSTEEDAKRAGVTEREVGLVFSVDSNNSPRALQGRLAGVYSFLPLEGEQTGLPFGVFGDFVCAGDRDVLVYDLPWNEWVCDEIALLFAEALKGLVDSSEGWDNFAVGLLNILGQSHQPLGGEGGKFWEERLRSPVLTALKRTPIIRDIHGTHRLLEDLLFPTDDVANALSVDALDEILDGLSSDAQPKYIANVGANIERPDGGEQLGIYKLVTMLATRPDNPLSPDDLTRVYRLLPSLSKDYYVRGRPDTHRRGSPPRDIPLWDLPFVLGQDGRLHSPSNVVVPPPKLSDGSETPAFLRKFIERRVSSASVMLHLVVGADTQALEGLGHCGLDISFQKDVLVALTAFLAGVNSERDCSEIGWDFPDDLIEATLYILAAGTQGFWLQRMVGADGQIYAPRALFVGGTDLDWSPLREEGLLPGFYRLHPEYTDVGRLRRLGLELETVHGVFKDLGVHGFDRLGDRDLVQDAAYAIAERELRREGHSPTRLQHRQDRGYDMECQNHCQAVFEVKGMGTPEDISLEPSEVKAADGRKKPADPDYVVVCVWHLPCEPANIGYKPLKGVPSIWEPVTEARIPLRNWL